VQKILRLTAFIWGIRPKILTEIKATRHLVWDHKAKYIKVDRVYLGNRAKYIDRYYGRQGLFRE